MNHKHKKEFVKLNTTIQNTSPQITIVIYKYKNLLKKVTDTSLLISIFQKLFLIFFKTDILNKNLILKVIKNKKINKKFTKNFDLVIFKSEIISILKINNYPITKCIIKLVKSHLNKFINDIEIMTEIIFMKNKRLNSKIFNLKPIYSDIIKRNSLCFKKSSILVNNECNYGKKNAILKSVNISEIIEYIKNNNDRFTIKLLCMYGIFKKYYNPKNVFVSDSKFLSYHEAENLYYNLKIFNPEWNKQNFIIVDYREIVKNDQTDYFLKYLVFKRCMRMGNLKQALKIIEILYKIDGLTYELRILFEYFYNNLRYNQKSKFSIDLYGINKKSEFLYFEKYFKIHQK